MTKLTIKCTKWVPLQRNTLRGFAEVHIADMRLSIADVAIHFKNGRGWAQLPGKPMLKDGTVIKDDTGKTKYQTLFAFDDRETANAFSAAVISAVQKFDPHALDSEEP